MKKFIVSTVVVAILMSVVAMSSAQTNTASSDGMTFRRIQNGVDIPVETKTVCMRPCRSETLTVTAPSQPVVAPATFTWIQQQPTVVTQVVVVQQAAPQPVIVQESVVYDTPRKVYYSSPLISVSAYAGVSSYGGYYPNTYWQNDSRCQEYRNIANTRYNYGMGGRSYNGYNGGSYGGGIRPMPPVNYMPGVNGVQLGNGGGRRR